MSILCLKPPSSSLSFNGVDTYVISLFQFCPTLPFPPEGWLFDVILFNTFLAKFPFPRTVKIASPNTSALQRAQFLACFFGGWCLEGSDVFCYAALAARAPLPYSFFLIRTSLQLLSTTQAGLSPLSTANLHLPPPQGTLFLGTPWRPATSFFRVSSAWRPFPLWPGSVCGLFR